MSVTCPNGHTSESTDYCDICGSPIGAGGSSGGNAHAAASGATNAHPATTAMPVGPSACPNCSFPALPDALFCENCGYDFTTGSLPENDPAPLLPPQLGQPVVPSAQAATPPSDPGSTPTPGSAPTPLSPPTPSPLTPPSGVSPAGAAPAATKPPATSTPDPTEVIPTAKADPVGPAADPVDPDPVSAVTAAAAPSGAAPSPASVDPTATTAPPLGGDPWIAEIWVDPEWYAAQQADDPLPSGGLPAIVVLRQRSVLVGRHSASRGIVPQIDCGTDSGVSRRHCQLNTDGQRWWVEDLQSSNGTFVSPAGEELPTAPITPGQRREVGDGDRIFIGGWTRIVIRKALPGEV